jgi:hypothetical protein
MKVLSTVLVASAISTSPGIKKMKIRNKPIHPPMNLTYDIFLGTSLG